MVPKSGSVTDVVLGGVADPGVEAVGDGEVEMGGEPAALHEDWVAVLGHQL